MQGLLTKALEAFLFGVLYVSTTLIFIVSKSFSLLKLLRTYTNTNQSEELSRQKI